jgi:predicted DNA-binding transcriptional regulator AlpA
MLPSKLLRFSDLHCVGIRNWPTLKRRVERDGFPAGRYLGRTRCWTVDEVEAWFESQPSAAPPENVKPGPRLQPREPGKLSQATNQAILNQPR